MLRTSWLALCLIVIGLDGLIDTVEAKRVTVNLKLSEDNTNDEGHEVASETSNDEAIVSDGETQGIKCCCYYWYTSKMRKNPVGMRGFCPAEYCSINIQMSEADPGDSCIGSKHRVTCWKQSTGNHAWGGGCGSSNSKTQDALSVLKKMGNESQTEEDWKTFEEELGKKSGKFANAVVALRKAQGWTEYSNIGEYLIGNDNEPFVEKTIMEAAKPDHPDVYNEWREYKYGSDPRKELVTWPFACDSQCFHSETHFKCLIGTYENYLGDTDDPEDDGSPDGLDCEKSIQVGTEPKLWTRLCKFDPDQIAYKPWKRLPDCPRNLAGEWPELIDPDYWEQDGRHPYKRRPV